MILLLAQLWATAWRGTSLTMVAMSFSRKGIRSSSIQIDNYRQPYDLAWLRNKKEVLDGTVDLLAITHVKYFDIPGTEVEETWELDNDGDGTTDETYTFYSQYDSFGYIIRDAYLTWGSGAADVYKPGVIHQAE